MRQVILIVGFEYKNNDCNFDFLKIVSENELLKKLGIYKSFLLR